MQQGKFPGTQALVPHIYSSIHTNSFGFEKGTSIDLLVSDVSNGTTPVIALSVHYEISPYK
jgi:hypothetical protein